MFQHSLIDYPTALACEAVRDWLTLKDLVQLDSAYCEASKRAALLDEIYPAPECVLADVPELKNGVQMASIEWIAVRSIRVKTLSLDECDERAAAYLRNRGQQIQRVHIHVRDGVPSAPILHSVAQSCVKLKSLHCTRVLPSDSLIDVLQKCTQLESFEFVEAHRFHLDTTFAIANSLPATHHLKLTSIDLDCDELSADCIFKMCDPESVRRMRVPAPADVNTFSWDHFTNLRTLKLGRNLLDDVLLLGVLTRCPWVVNLDISGSEFLTDEGVIEAVRMLHSLKAISIESAENLTEVAVNGIVQYHGQTLEAFFTDGCDTIRYFGINRVLRRCPLLRTIRFCYIDSIELYSMDKITTLIIDYPEDEDMWMAVKNACRCVEHLYIKFSHRCMGQTDYSYMTYVGSELPALRVLHIMELKEELKELRDQRPRLRIMENKDDTWHDHF